MILTTVEEALDALQKIQAEPDPVDEEIIFGGELAAFRIVVEGQRYHGTIPAELARGIWEFQVAMYRASAYALTGVEDARKLSDSQREKLELVFKVEEGSSDLLAKFTGFIDALGEGFKKLDRKQRMIILIVLALMLSGGVIGWKALSESAATKRAQIEANVRIQNEQEKTRQFEIFSQIASRDPIAKRFEKAAEDGTTAIVKGAPDATSIRVGRANFDRSDIQEINQRGARVNSVSNAVIDDYRINYAETKLADSTRYLIAGSDGVEFPVIVNHSELSADDQEKLWAAAKARSTIKLEVAITKNRGQVKAAQIVQVL